MSRCYWIGCTICLFQQLALLALSEARSATSEALPPASEAFSAASEVLSAGWLPGTPKGPLYRFGADLLKLRWVWRIDTSTHRCTEGPKDRCTDASMHRRTDGPMQSFCNWCPIIRFKLSVVPYQQIWFITCNCLLKIAQVTVFIGVTMGKNSRIHNRKLGSYYYYTTILQHTDCSGFEAFSMFFKPDSV